VRQVTDGGTFFLGTGEAMVSADADGVFLRYGSGQPCAGTSRSARVYLVCAPTFAVVSAAEPATCNYVLTASHPGLCAAGGGILPRLSAAAAIASAPGVSASRGSLRQDVQQWLDAYDAALTAASEAAAAANPDSRDVAGTGGRSIGVDDHLRRCVVSAGEGGGGSCVGFAPCSGAAPASMASGRVLLVCVWRGGGGADVGATPLCLHVCHPPLLADLHCVQQPLVLAQSPA
jgi:hypothetical protein